MDQGTRFTAFGNPDPNLSPHPGKALRKEVKLGYLASTLQVVKDGRILWEGIAERSLEWDGPTAEEIRPGLVAINLGPGNAAVLAVPQTGRIQCRTCGQIHCEHINAFIKLPLADEIRNKSELDTFTCDEEFKGTVKDEPVAFPLPDGPATLPDRIEPKPENGSSCEHGQLFFRYDRALTVYNERGSAEKTLTLRKLKVTAPCQCTKEPSLSAHGLIPAGPTAAVRTALLAGLLDQLQVFCSLKEWVSVTWGRLLRKGCPSSHTTSP